MFFCRGQEWAYRAAFSTSGEEEGEESRYYISTTCVGKREEKPQRTTHAVGEPGRGRGSLVLYIYAELLPRRRGRPIRQEERSLLMVQARGCGAIIHRRDTMYYALTKKNDKKTRFRQGRGKKDERQKKRLFFMKEEKCEAGERRPGEQV